MGYCDYGCHACGEICPVQAIPALNLAVKRKKIIGCAHIDRDRCLAWADETPCIVCEEMCPLPEKAVYLEDTQIEVAQGETMAIQQPHVLPELCIGCGICEFKCPVEGEAAIRVYSPTARLET
jgi:ferredoxin